MGHEMFAGWMIGVFIIFTIQSLCAFFLLRGFGLTRKEWVKFHFLNAVLYGSAFGVVYMIILIIERLAK